jgi:hypothetical protein
MTLLRSKRRGAVLGLLLGTLVLTSCDTPQRKFDSAEWKAGDATTRGSMAQDLIDSKLLIGKSMAEVEGLLGKPDPQFEDAHLYKVVTIARCRFWECRLGVVFDHASSRVTFVAVND